MVTPPRALTEDALIGALIRKNSWAWSLLRESSNIELNCQNLQWIEPGGLTPLACVAENRGWKMINLNDELRHYFQRLGLAEAFGLHDKFKFENHDPTGRFIMPTWIREDQHIEPVINHVKQLLSQSSLADEVRWATTWSINELLGNVLIHAKAQLGDIVFAQTWPSKSKGAIAVSDAGIGIYGSVQSQGICGS